MRRKHEDFHDGAKDGLTPLEPLDINAVQDFDELLRPWARPPSAAAVWERPPRS